jgi:hypothetical protein
MRPRKRINFKAKRVKIEKTGDPRKDHWRFGKKHIAGESRTYSTVDYNFSPPAKWTFVVRVPRDLSKGNYIEVRPVDHPPKAYWAGIEQKAITFNKATKVNYRGYVYAKIFLPNLKDKNKNKYGIRRGDRPHLPNHLRKFKLRLKGTVAGTNAQDYNSQVAVVRRDDYKNMIKLFLSMKAWIMYSGFILEKRTESSPSKVA